MKTILFVDDDPVVITAYRGGLVREGFQVEVAEDGLAAMKVLPVLKPDVVLLDLVMPKVDGLYVLKFIHSRSELKSTMVIILSDASIADLAQKALEQKPDRVFLKSRCSPKELVAAIHELLEPREVLAANRRN